MKTPKNDPNDNYAEYEKDREAKRAAQSVTADKSAQHTPGPWKVRHDPNGKPHDWVKTPGGFVIARVPHHGGNGSGRPDARLIAAAPELLEACKQLLSLCEFAKVGLPGAVGFRQLQNTRDAIAKATNTLALSGKSESTPSVSPGAIEAPITLLSECKRVEAAYETESDEALEIAILNLRAAIARAEKGAK